MFYYANVGFIAAGPRRRNILTKEFMEKEFGAEHKEATGRNIGALGYPDTGSGRYVMASGYKNWMEFNTGQRISGNFLEWHMQVVTCLLIAGIHFPIVSTSVTVIYLLARMLYFYGYSKGP
jgi:hypothetical protein